MTLPKQEPYHLRCPTIADLPSLEELVALAEKHDCLLIQVPAEVAVGTDNRRIDPNQEAIRKLVADIVPRLPAHDVRDSPFIPDETSLPAARRNAEGSILTGMSRFGIRRFVTTEAILDHRDLFLWAIARYDALATTLMHRLSTQLGADVSEFAASEYWHAYEQTGLLSPVSNGSADDTWHYFFHGSDCMFTNAKTGVTVEARLGFGADCGNHFGILDPGFFQCFLETSAVASDEFVPLVNFLPQWSDALRSLEVLEQQGLLRRVISADELAGGWHPVPV